MILSMYSEIYCYIDWATAVNIYDNVKLVKHF